MDILGKARRLESKLTRTVDRAAKQWSRSGPRGPLEVLHGVLAAVRERVEPAGRGTHVFPFNRIKLVVVADSRDARARFSGVLDGDPPLQQRVLAILSEAGCEVPGLHVRTVFVAAPEPGWATPEFHVEFGRATPAEPPEPARAPVPEVKLTIAQGSAEKPAYALALDRINLGRCPEVRDSRNHLIRTNHVVFKDGDPANGSVSRRHAHIEYSDRTGDHRLVDDRSAQGTTIVRSGQTIVVPAGARGVRLQSGDDVILGEARVRVRIAGAE